MERTNPKDLLKGVETLKSESNEITTKFNVDKGTILWLFRFIEGAIKHIHYDKIVYWNNLSNEYNEGTLDFISSVIQMYLKHNPNSYIKSPNGPIPYTESQIEEYSKAILFS